MCEFCDEDKIPEIENEYDVNPLKAETEDFPFREKLILAKLHGKYVFYGFNKYRYEDDTIYYETEANHCPVCGRKLVEV